LVSQSGDTLTIAANGQSQSVTGTFGDIVLHAGAGDDVLPVDSSVVIQTYLYGDTGSNQYFAQGSARMPIVAIGGEADTLTGNGINTSYWADQAGVDTINASSAEINGGMVHRVASFYQPWTTNTASPDYISKQLNGQDLKDPTDAANLSRDPNRSL